MKRRTLLAAAAGIVAAPALHAQARDIVLGLSMVKSGPLKSPGEATETAVDIAVAEINGAGGVAGRPIRLVKFDTGSDPRQAATAVQKFARDDNALAVIGPFSSGEAAVAFPVGERLGIVQVSTSSSAPGLTGNNTYAWRMTEDEGKQFGRLLTSLQRKNIPSSKAEIIYISDERVSAITATQFYPGLLRERNIAFGEPVSFQYRTFDVAPQVTQVLQRGPEVIALAATPDGAGKVLRELRRQGFRGRVIGSQIFADPNSVELFGPEGEGMLIVAGFWWDRNDATRAFTTKYREENARRGLAQKRIPHHSDAQAYDATYLLKQAIERAQVTGEPARVAAERTAIRDALRGLRFTGVTGENTCFDAARDAELPGFIVEIRNQAWSLFDQFPADACS
jgi:branched-chain amino acid transport system substrate-binding protein